MREIIERVLDRADLTEDEASSVMGQIMSGGWADPEIAALLTALRMKGETADELVGFARVMRRNARSVWGDDEPLEVVDTCGTGGDASGTFNISTAAAFVAAGAGARVAKHGNRAASSRTGAADVLEELGIDIQMSSEQLQRALREVGIAFLFAPAFHLSMKHVMPVRRALGFRTVFNVLGPLVNPAGARSQVVGVFDAGLLDRMAVALGRLGTRHAFVVHGEGGLDEVSTAGRTDIVEVKETVPRHFAVHPDDFGVRPSGIDALQGGDAARNARIIEEVLAGAAGPHRDAVLLNAAFAIAAAGLTSDAREGFEAAAEAIDSGKAREKLEALREASNS